MDRAVSCYHRAVYTNICVSVWCVYVWGWGGAGCHRVAYARGGALVVCVGGGGRKRLL